MIQIEGSIVMEEILSHISEQRTRAKLTDKPFQLGIATDKRPSQVLGLIHNEENEAILKEIGMTEYKWHYDALRSNLRVAGEELLMSICSPR
jgi:hypothetical protein